MNIAFWVNRKRYKNIYLRLSTGHQRKEISTGFHIDPKVWGGTYILAKGKSPEARLLNQRLQHIKFKIDNIIFELEKKGDQAITPLLVKNMYEGKTEQDGEKSRLHASFDRYLSLSKNSLTLNTLKSYRYAVEDFKAFLVLNDLTDIYTHSINTSITKRYLDSLRNRKNSYRTIKIKFARLSTMFEVIMNDFQCLKPEYNPFSKLIIKKTKTESNTIENENKWVDMDVQLTIENTAIDSPLTYYRNMFLFQVHTGLAWIDMMKFNPDEHIVIDIDNFKWIRLRRTKTIKSNRYSEILLSNEIEELILFFKKNQTSNTLINKVSYNTYWVKLREIAKIMKIKTLTSHMARHTFGVRLLENGASMETVSHMMGHSTIKTTESIYAKVTKRKIKMDLKKAGIIA